MNSGNLAMCERWVVKVVEQRPDDAEDEAGEWQEAGAPSELLKRDPEHKALGLAVVQGQVTSCVHHNRFTGHPSSPLMPPCNPNTRLNLHNCETSVAFPSEHYL